jgi:hypothetical protein
MGLSSDGQYDDVLGEGYVAGTINVSTIQIEAKVGANRLAGREYVRVFNNSAGTIYFGPSGVTISTGEPLYKSQWVSIPLGDVGIYLIAATSLTDIRIQEFA